ncbi:hypothetical protein Tco_0241715 [Tanacetum coccineum]
MVPPTRLCFLPQVFVYVQEDSSQEQYCPLNLTRQSYDCVYVSNNRCKLILGRLAFECHDPFNRPPRFINHVSLGGVISAIALVFSTQVTHHAIIDCSLLRFPRIELSCTRNSSEAAGVECSISMNVRAQAIGMAFRQWKLYRKDDHQTAETRTQRPLGNILWDIFVGNVAVSGWDQFLIKNDLPHKLHNFVQRFLQGAESWGLVLSIGLMPEPLSLSHTTSDETAGWKSLYSF